jgi:hypothetical protein
MIKKILNYFRKEQNNKIINTIDPYYVENWKEAKFKEDVRLGIISLHKGQDIVIYNTGNAYKLASAIKEGFINDKIKELSDKVKIEFNTSLSDKLTIKIR